MPLGLEVEEGFTCSVWSIEPVGKVLARDLPNPRNAYAIRLWASGPTKVCKVKHFSLNSKPFQPLHSGALLVAQMAKNLLAMQETWVQSLGQEDSLEKGMAIHSSILSWRIPWTEEPGGLQSRGSQRVGHNWEANTHTHTHIQGSIEAQDYKIMSSPWKKMKIIFMIII